MPSRYYHVSETAIHCGHAEALCSGGLKQERQKRWCRQRHRGCRHEMPYVYVGVRDEPRNKTNTFDYGCADIFCGSGRSRPG